MMLVPAQCRIRSHCGRLCLHLCLRCPSLSQTVSRSLYPSLFSNALRSLYAIVIYVRYHVHACMYARSMCECSCWRVCPGTMNQSKCLCSGICGFLAHLAMTHSSSSTRQYVTVTCDILEYVEQNSKNRLTKAQPPNLQVTFDTPNNASSKCIIPELNS